MLFDEIPPVTFPAGNALPSSAQDLLEDYRMCAQRLFVLQQEKDAEEAELLRILKRLKKALPPGESATFAGLTAVHTEAGHLSVQRLE